jgi:hypothetical protein
MRPEQVITEMERIYDATPRAQFVFVDATLAHRFASLSNSWPGEYHASNLRSFFRPELVEAIERAKNNIADQVARKLTQ